MKKILFAIFLLQTILVFAQSENKCGTKAEKSEWLKKYQKNPSAYQKRDNETLFVPITIHLLGNDDGASFYNFGVFLDDLCVLNRDFEQTNIQFFLNEPPRYLKSTKWNNHKTFDEGVEMFDNNVPNTINSYFVNDPAGNCGYDWPGTGIALGKGCMGKYNHTWAHETGHELSLPHTFSGWEGMPYSDLKGAPLQINGQDVEQLGDTVNCNNVADGFCDTPPDYFSSRWTCGADRKSASDVKDPNGKKFKIRGDFFMSYANDACETTFSKEQTGAMRAHLLSEKLDFLATENPYKPLVGFSKSLAPQDSSVFTTKKIEFKWSSVKNASNYFLEVSRSSNFDSKDYAGSLKDTSITLELGYKKYFWRVRAYNLGFSCSSDLAKKNIFRIVEPTSANDVLKLNEFLLFPNPIANGQKINIQFDADFSENATLEIIDINAKSLINKKIQINNGFNTFEIETPLANGFYILNIKTKKGIKQDKIIVNND
jgi:hypothetical protein